MDKVTELIIANLLGLVIGLGTSFFSWWVLYHKIVPDLKFAAFISKIVMKDGTGHRYRVKFKNVGGRAIFDVHVIARLVIDWDGSNIWNAFYIPLSPYGSARYEMPKIVRGGERTLDLYPSRAADLLASERAPPEMVERGRLGILALEDLFEIKEHVELKVYIFGYDEFSGTRKLFESKSFTLADIHLGDFSGLERSIMPVVSSVQNSDA